MASVDTQQVIEQSQLLPISDKPDPNPTKFTHSVTVSGFRGHGDLKQWQWRHRFLHVQGYIFDRLELHTLEVDRC